MELRKIIAFLITLCLILTLVGCKSEVASDNTVTTSQSSSQSDISSAAESLGSTQSQVDDNVSNAFKPITPPEELNVDKTVTVFGALTDKQYGETLQQLQNVLDGYSYNVSLAVYSLDGSRGLEYNTNAQIFGACTVKAAYTLYACKQMEAGIGSLETQLTYEEKHYEPGTGDMQYSPFGTVFDMKTALYKSMSISDNVGYMMAVDYFGRDGYNTWISEMGCDSLQIKPTVWSLKTQANDLIKIWFEIYNYFKTDTEYARFLKESCTNTAGNYATAALSGVEYSHKQGHNSTGDWLSLSDAGIVWKGDTPYVIAILTDAPGPSAYSADVFAQIINIVHNDLF